MHSDLHIVISDGRGILHACMRRSVVATNHCDSVTVLENNIAEFRMTSQRNVFPNTFPHHMVPWLTQRLTNEGAVHMVVAPCIKW